MPTREQIIFGRLIDCIWRLMDAGKAVYYEFGESDERWIAACEHAKETVADILKTEMREPVEEADHLKYPDPEIRDMPY